MRSEELRRHRGAQFDADLVETYSPGCSRAAKWQAPRFNPDIGDGVVPILANGVLGRAGTHIPGRARSSA